MSWFQPTDSKKKYYLFGKDGGKFLAAEYDIDLLAQLPLVEKINEQDLSRSDTIINSFKTPTDKIVKLLKKIRSKKVDSIPQKNVSN